jgi:secondary thiamine-phosphate synthase enzyme
VMAMKVTTRSFEVDTQRENDVLDVTESVREAVTTSKLSSGVATVFVVGSTAALMTIEYEPGLVKDFPAMLARLVPREGVAYEHEKRWRDGNGHSHVKASLVGPSLSVPFVDGELALGEWQQIVLAEFDTRPRRRKVLVQVMGE